MKESDSLVVPVFHSAAGPGNDRPVDARNTKLKHRLEARDLATISPRDEVLVVDERSNQRPAHLVENKLTRLLKDASVPVSHLQMRGLLRSR